MMGNVFASSKISETDLDLLFENASFPLTKAELIYKAEMAGVSLTVLELIHSLPSRFYRSRAEVINHCINRKFQSGHPLILIQFVR